MILFLKDHLPLPSEIEGVYIEPFVGGGAVFFHLQPPIALLADANPELIDIYRGIRYSPKAVWKLYCKFGGTKQDYQYVRDQIASESLTERAARMLFLNRTCFKGMWRHNKEGNFNVGYGGQARRWVITEKDLQLTCGFLRKAKLRCSDFEDTIDLAKEGDFLFLDPPYRPGSREYMNDHYVGQKFDFSEHQRLSIVLQKAKRRGANWAMTTSSHPDIVNLFKKNYAQDIPQGTGKMPGITTKNSGEVFISSYKAEGGKKL
jgi:DNA adenine methylase